MQVNYDFHDNLTTVKVDEIIETYRAGQGKDVK
jgi:NADH-quinone oxidoreductase subunit E